MYELLLDRLMDKIQCQGKSCKENGCPSCGGYGYIIAKAKCNCGQEYWARPGQYTRWEGKEWYSFDGLKIICHLDGPSECAKCVIKSTGEE